MVPKFNFKFLIFTIWKLHLRFVVFFYSAVCVWTERHREKQLRALTLGRREGETNVGADWPLQTGCHDEGAANVPGPQLQSYANIPNDLSKYVDRGFFQTGDLYFWKWVDGGAMWFRRDFEQGLVLMSLLGATGESARRTGCAKSHRDSRMSRRRARAECLFTPARRRTWSVRQTTARRN